MSKQSVARKRPRPERPRRAALRAGLRPGPASFWRDGAPPAFTREELVDKRRLVAAIERDLGRHDLITQLARAVHAVCLRESHRAEAWLRQQLRTLGPPQ